MPSEVPSRPWLFSCRHTHEDRLVEELSRLGCDLAAPASSIPGLVRADGLPETLSAAALAAWDPVWALQVLPAAELLCAQSIGGLARAVAARLVEPIDATDGPWLLHTLVPGMLKGQPKPPLERRAGLLTTAVGEQLVRTRRRAWRRRQLHCRRPELMVQLLLVDAERLWLSVSPTLGLPLGGTWPSPLAAGLAKVADDPAAPSSAFRKLDEALACMGRWPARGDTAVDLGAAPGGWTRVLLRYGARVLAVDRSPLADHLMRSPDLQWRQGDAFAFRPEAPVDWLVSDVAAFPERVAELLEIWCSARLATNLVVQMKFKGATDWLALDVALATARRHGFAARARHFFNDKNEVTLMAVAPTQESS